MEAGQQMIVAGGMSLLGIIWAVLALINWVNSLITGEKPAHGGPRKRAGLKYRHTTDTRWK